MAEVTTDVAPSGNRFTRWLFPSVPLARVAVLRTIVYVFVIYDVLVYSKEVRLRADVPTELYVPLNIPHLIPFFPAPTATVVGFSFWAILVLAPIAATGRSPRLVGWTLFVLYFEWRIINFSYGKVDHAHWSIIVAMLVLPSVGRARHGDLTPSSKAGWALRVTQLGCISTYFLSSIAKLRYGGIQWLWGSTLTWAIIRRGTVFADWLTNFPLLIKASQVGIVTFELLSPVVFFLKEKWQRYFVAYLFTFHLFTFIAITISFAPHLTTLFAFLPIERIRPVRWLVDRVRRMRSAAPAPA